MSSNAPQIQQPDDPFTPKRLQGAFRRVRHVGKGKNRHLEFKGQEPDEVIKAVIRKHKFFLFVPALPLIASVLGFIIVGALFGADPSADAFWTLLEVILGFLIVITGVYFVYKSLILWWLETNIVTNKRIIIWKGFLSPNRDEFGIDKVVQVGVDQRGLISLLLSYGNVHLYLVGGKQPILKEVPHPREVNNLFEKITDEYRRNKPASAPRHPDPENPELLGVLAQLSEKETPPELPNPDEKYARFHRPEKVRGPLRTFGGPLHLPCNVTYNGDEYTVKYIQRARSVLVAKLIPPVLIFLGLIVSLFYLTALELYISIAILAMFFVFAYIIINYWDDIYILTSKRIIDINRRFVFLDEEHLSIEYSQIKSVDVRVGNPIYLALDVGRVIVETPGNNPDIIMRVVDHPFSIQDMIYHVKGYKEKVDKINAKNDRKAELNQWFGTVLATMERNVLGKGVPNLQKLDLFTAAERANALGMKVVFAGEDPSYPNIAPGLIVSQNPIPGTLVEASDPAYKPQIRVVLSRQP
jgi:Bacterial PH domain/PASTA domain